MCLPVQKSNFPRRKFIQSLENTMISALDDYKKSYTFSGILSSGLYNVLGLPLVLTVKFASGVVGGFIGAVFTFGNLKYTDYFAWAFSNCIGAIVEVPLQICKYILFIGLSPVNLCVGNIRKSPLEIYINKLFENMTPAHID